MQNHANSNMDPAELMRMAQSPAGQRLLAMLRQNGAQELWGAMEKASGGDYRDIQKALQTFLNNPEAQALVEQLRNS